MSINTAEYSMLLTITEAFMVAPEKATDIYDLIIGKRKLPEGFQMKHEYSDNFKELCGEILAIIILKFEQNKESKLKFLAELMTIKQENKLVEQSIQSRARMLTRLEYQKPCKACGRY